jgi:hypothetical protein
MSIGYARGDPLNFLFGLAVTTVFGQAPALLIALAWDHEPTKLVDMIVRQLRAVEGAPATL